MKTIGLIGGMSYESTIVYYKLINKFVNERLSGLHSAKMIIESYDFDEIEKEQSKENWKRLTEILINSAQKLEKAGADYIAIATNTMHLMADDVQKNISIPLIHIADAAANYIQDKNLKTVALFGTKYTMTKSFYKDKLRNDYKINVIVPNIKQQEIINHIIYNELCVGLINEDSRKAIFDIIADCTKQGAQGVVLGCTELPILINNANIPIINTTEVHCLEIVKRIIA